MPRKHARPAARKAAIKRKAQQATKPKMWFEAYSEAATITQAAWAFRIRAALAPLDVTDAQIAAEAHRASMIQWEE